jgi:hypothetical protein
MLSHNFRLGTWKKRKQTGKDHFHFLMNSSNAQRSFIHEACSQALGHAPSRLWGHVEIPPELMPSSDPDTLQFTRNAAKHSAHEFGRVISTHKKAGSLISSIGEMIGDAGKASAGYLGKVGRFVLKNGDAIKTGISIGKDVIQTGTSIAQLAGWMSQDNKDTLDSIAAVVDRHAQGDTYKSKKDKAAKGAKTGGAFRRILV